MPLLLRKAERERILATAIVKLTDYSPSDIDKIKETLLTYSSIEERVAMLQYFISLTNNKIDKVTALKSKELDFLNLFKSKTGVDRPTESYKQTVAINHDEQSQLLIDLKIELEGMLNYLKSTLNVNSKKKSQEKSLVKNINPKVGRPKGSSENIVDRNERIVNWYNQLKNDGSGLKGGALFRKLKTQYRLPLSVRSIEDICRKSATKGAVDKPINPIK